MIQFDADALPTLASRYFAALTQLIYIVPDPVGPKTVAVIPAVSQPAPEYEFRAGLTNHESSGPLYTPVDELKLQPLLVTNLFVCTGVPFTSLITQFT